MSRFVLAIVFAAACHSGSPSLRDPTTGTELFLGYRSPPPGRDLTTGLGTIGARVASALRQGYRDQLDRAPPPVSLTPTDGTELAIDVGIVAR